MPDDASPQPAHYEQPPAWSGRLMYEHAEAPYDFSYTPTAELDTLVEDAEPARPAGPAEPEPRPRAPRFELPAWQLVTYWALMAVGLLLAGRFALFWFNPARLPRAFGRALAPGDFALFAGLTLVIWHRQAMEILTWLICRRIGKSQEPPSPEAGLRVAFITTFVPGSEPLDLLKRTLGNMQRADYPHDTWLLDEGNGADVRALCREMGVLYFSRNGLDHYNQDRGRYRSRTKAGNHNSWYTEYSSNYDIVAQIDTDFQVRPNFLTRTLGYFRDPQIAFVGTPQVYGNVDNFIARGAGQQTYLFYGPIMRALSQRRMALLIGANHIVRVVALWDVGGYQGHLTEDLATGVRFHASRWESVYVPEVLAVGEGPTSWQSYFAQQYRWAYGCINIFFAQTLRLNFRMRPNHAFYYFLLQQFYFNGLAMVIAVVLLLLYDFFGWVPANFEIHQLVLWYLPLLAWRQIMLLWLQRFNVRREERGMMWAGRILTIAAIPVYFLAFAGVVCNKRATWKTTPKGAAAGEDAATLADFKPHIGLLLVVLTGLGAGILRGHTALIFLAWGSVTACAMTAFVLMPLYARITRVPPRKRVLDKS